MRHAGRVVLMPILVLAIMVAALIDAITRRDDQVKHLPKFAWVLFIVFLPLIGSVLWFTLGREWDTSPRESMSFGDPRRWSKDAAATATPAPQPRDHRTTAQQLADLEREIEIAELEAEIRRRRGQAPEAG